MTAGLFLLLYAIGTGFFKKSYPNVHQCWGYCGHKWMGGGSCYQMWAGRSENPYLSIYLVLRSLLYPVFQDWVQSFLVVVFLRGREECREAQENLEGGWLNGEVVWNQPNKPTEKLYRCEEKYSPKYPYGRTLWGTAMEDCGHMAFWLVKIKVQTISLYIILAWLIMKLAGWVFESHFKPKMLFLKGTLEWKLKLSVVIIF